MATDYLLAPLNSGKSNNVVLGYSPNDFYYQNANATIKLDEETCKQVQTEDCNTISDINKQQCLNQAYCSNRVIANKLKDIQNKNNGAIEKYEDTNLEYDFIIYNIINLGIGVFAMVGCILFFRPLKI